MACMQTLPTDLFIFGPVVQRVENANQQVQYYRVHGEKTIYAIHRKPRSCDEARSYDVERIAN